MQLQLSLLCHQVSSAAPNLGSGDFITALAALAKLELFFFFSIKEINNMKRYSSCLSRSSEARSLARVR